MSSVTREKVQQALLSVKGLSESMVQDIVTEDTRVVVTLRVDPAMGSDMEPLRQNAQAAVTQVAGVEQAMVVLTAERNVPPAPAAPAVQHKISSRPVAPGVKKIIAVASGKGGVGKSTVSANLAAALAVRGVKTGLLDADIYGPSQTLMMGHATRPETNADGMIIPPVVHGITLMSMGFFVDSRAPVIWRGPMVHSAIQQLLRDVEWGGQDVLVIDLPPGTGDAQLSLAQNVPLHGAVIVSTPQEVARSEAHKAIAMFEKVNVPVLGLVENMYSHICAQCGHEEHIFGTSPVQDKEIPVLGRVPLHMDVCTAGDAGKPLVLAHPDHIVTQAFQEIAAKLYGD